jgi:hypothetical protein
VDFVPPPGFLLLKILFLESGTTIPLLHYYGESSLSNPGKAMLDSAIEFYYRDII